MKTALEDNAMAELARASRLERMASDLMVEAREIRAKYSTGRKPKQRTSMVQLAKSIKSRGDIHG